LRNADSTTRIKTIAPAIAASKPKVVDEKYQNGRKAAKHKPIANQNNVDNLQIIVGTHHIG
jgi:hypothetical protein